MQKPVIGKRNGKGRVEVPVALPGEETEKVWHCISVLQLGKEFGVQSAKIELALRSLCCSGIAEDPEAFYRYIRIRKRSFFSLWFGPGQSLLFGRGDATFSPTAAHGIAEISPRPVHNWRNTLLRRNAESEVGFFVNGVLILASLWIVKAFLQIKAGEAIFILGGWWHEEHQGLG